MFPKPKLTVYHAASEKIGMLESLKTVLKLYAVYDESISYIQGINLIAASIIVHMKEVEGSFIILKELMNYGKLRSFYVNDFALLKKEASVFYHTHLKNYIYELYEHFVYFLLSSDVMEHLAPDHNSRILYMSFRLDSWRQLYGIFLIKLAHSDWSVFLPGGEFLAQTFLVDASLYEEWFADFRGGDFNKDGDYAYENFADTLGSSDWCHAVF